ncbi:MAG TPA: hypothetical protein VIE13_11335 [Terriglobales bacterium]
MYARKLTVTLVGPEGGRPCPVAHLDNFAMRSFTGETRFDDTLPVGDGKMEIGTRVPLQPLQAAMQDWFRRKSYLRPGEQVQVEEVQGAGL